jgi:hypothetical protein
MDVHTFFELSYANYLVLPRTLLQSMPEEWQERFVGMVQEMEAVFAHVPQAPAYLVTAAEEREVGALTKQERRQLGIFEDREGEELVYLTPGGDELDPWHRVLRPITDPVPHYDRGRTRIAPAGPTVEG